MKKRGIAEFEDYGTVEFENHTIRFGVHESKKWYHAIDLIASLNMPFKTVFLDKVSPKNKKHFVMKSKLTEEKTVANLFLSDVGVTQIVGRLDIPSWRKMDILRAIFPESVNKLRGDYKKASWDLQIDRRMLKMHYKEKFGILRTATIKGRLLYIATDLARMPILTFKTRWLVGYLEPQQYEQLCVVGYGNNLLGIKTWAIEYDGILALLPKMTKDDTVRASLKKFIDDIRGGNHWKETPMPTNATGNTTQQQTHAMLQKFFDAQQEQIAKLLDAMAKR